MGDIEIEWVLGESASHALAHEFNQEGMQTEAPRPFKPSPDAIEDFPDPQFEPLMIVAATLSIGFLIKRVVDAWLDLKGRGTLVIDARGEKLQVRTELTGDPGTLVVVDNEGARVYQQERKDEAVAALRAVAGAA